MMESFERKFSSLGTDIAVEIVVQEGAFPEGLMEEIEEKYRTLEKIFSRFDEESELSIINRNLGEWRTASPEMIELAGKSLVYHRKSGGIFDPRVIEALENFGYRESFKTMPKTGGDSPKEVKIPESPLDEDLNTGNGEILFRVRMDFSGIAKGYIADKVAEHIRKRGVENFFLDSGGDIWASGKDKDGKDWRISVEGFPEGKADISLREKAIATSGISRRKWERGGKKFHHLIDPRDPNRFDFSLRSVSVIGKTVEEADLDAKFLFLLGREEGFRKAQELGIGALFLDYSGNIQVSSEIKKYLC